MAGHIHRMVGAEASEVSKGLSISLLSGLLSNFVWDNSSRPRPLKVHPIGQGSMVPVSTWCESVVGYSVLSRFKTHKQTACQLTNSKISMERRPEKAGPPIPIVDEHLAAFEQEDQGPLP